MTGGDYKCMSCHDQKSRKHVNRQDLLVLMAAQNILCHLSDIQALYEPVDLYRSKSLAETKRCG